MSSKRKIDAAGDDLILRGQTLYNERLRAHLEPTHVGRFVAIEPVTGQYFLGDTGTVALIAARAAMPSALFYLMRVGQQTAHTVGGYASRVR